MTGVDRHVEAVDPGPSSGPSARSAVATVTGPATARQTGQSTVEVVAMLPVVAVVVVALLQALSAGLAAELAGHAAEAGAVALLQDRDPREAARKALPGWSRDRADVTVRGHRVRVRLDPPSVSSGLARLLATTVEADAGPFSG